LNKMVARGANLRHEDFQYSVPKSTRLPVFEYSHLTNDCLELGHCTKVIAIWMPKDGTGSQRIDYDFVVGSE
jgi:hypothetical protein